MTKRSSIDISDHLLNGLIAQHDLIRNSNGFLAVPSWECGRVRSLGVTSALLT